MSASTGFIIVNGGIIIVRGDGPAFANVAKQVAAEVGVAAAATTGEVMTATELTDLAKSAAEAAQDNDPVLGGFKVVGSAAFGTAVGVVTAPFFTPLGGAAVGFMAGKAYEAVFDFFRGMSQSTDWNSDLPNDWATADPLGNPINGDVSHSYDASRTMVFKDPLVLDLDNDGIETIGVNVPSPVLFDHNADGVKSATGWIKPDDGIVVLDRNGNGLIDSGRELFGDNTVLSNGPKAGQLAANGFEALADLDANADGNIDAQDAAYTQLRIWQDVNQNGISEAGELHTLAEAGVASIAAQGSATDVNLGNGNIQSFGSTFVRTDGSSGDAGTTQFSGSLLLASSNFYRVFPDTIAHTAAAEALPDMRGMWLAARPAWDQYRRNILMPEENRLLREAEFKLSCEISNLLKSRRYAYGDFELEK